ncbi:NAD(P)-binding Rossmann-fold superfamily protein [Striga asiatica]|uniref:NAD(P)-binding Rossmann-fold superfamily protein n=1 Tax=Striga asiatica TaxID=4170 RepID=A0A5A7P9V8_STRAF|nr:NAD(P)-binding Rossmann-fold superfamily protein [Striga asiatica]
MEPCAAGFTYLIMNGQTIVSLFVHLLENQDFLTNCNIGILRGFNLYIVLGCVLPLPPTYVTVRWNFFVNLSSCFSVLKTAMKDGPGLSARFGSTCPAPMASRLASSLATNSSRILFPVMSRGLAVVIMTERIAAGLQSGCAPFRSAATPEA